MLMRAYTPADCEAMARLFYETIHTVNAADYTQAQLNAWATGTVDLEVWNNTFLAHDTRVAVMDGILVGFGDMDGTGYLDKLFIHRQYQRRGIAAAICCALEQNAAAQGIALLTTHASITARPFFEGRGYRVVKAQKIERRGQILDNFIMHKLI